MGALRDQLMGTLTSRKTAKKIKNKKSLLKKGFVLKEF